VQTQLGRITVFTQTSLAEVDSTANSVRDALLIAVPCLVALVALATWYFTGRALRPVEAIRLEAEEITGTTMHRGPSPTPTTRSGASPAP
jgi:hypothetical protein